MSKHFIPVRKLDKHRHTRDKHDHHKERSSTYESSDHCHDDRKSCSDCCEGIAEAYGTYYEAAGSLFQEKMLLLYNVEFEQIVFLKRFNVFNNILFYFANNVRDTLIFLQDNCSEGCCDEVALAVSKVSIGFLEVIFTLILDPRSDPPGFIDLIHTYGALYGSILQTLINKLCKEDTYEPNSLPFNICNPLPPG